MDFGPVFRAEKSKTRRHLNEFWMMDAEIPFIQQDENMQIQEDLLKYIIRQVLENNSKDLTLLGRDTTPLSSIVDKPWPRMTHEEFVADLIAKWFDVKQGDDIGSDIEMQYMEMIDTPIFLTHFPLGIKAFYTKEDPKNQDMVSVLISLLQSDVEKWSVLRQGTMIMMSCSVRSKNMD